MAYFQDFRAYAPKPPPVPKMPRYGLAAPMDDTPPSSPATPPATPTPAPIPNVPPATTPTPGTAPTPAGYAGLPSQYTSGLTAFVGDPAAYYASYGGEKQAQQDYYSMLNMWQQRTGLALTPDAWVRVWHALNEYRNPSVLRGENRTFTMGDALNYMNRMLVRAPEKPAVSYLQTGEI